MRRYLMFFAIACHVMVVLVAWAGWAQSADSIIVAWGGNLFGQCDVPSPNEGFVTVAGGFWHSLGLKSDGMIVTWGSNYFGQCDVPLPNEGFTEIAGGDEHSLGLKSDGTIVAWGNNSRGQCNVPSPNEGFVAIAGGHGHSLGLKSDGTIVAWGWNVDGQCNVPSPNEGFIAVAGGVRHSLGLKSDGTIVAWGWNGDGRCDVPLPNEGFIAVAGGGRYSLGLKSDGTIVAWGDNYWGICNVPAPNEGFVAIEGGRGHGLGLKFDGTIVAWGHCYSGKCDVPSPNEGFIAVAGGGHHSLGLRYLEPTVVSFDIHPRSCPNPFNMKWLENDDRGGGSDHALHKKGGVMPAAVTGSEGFNVSEIDSSTLFLEGIAPLRTSLEDVTRPVTDGGECACTTGGPDGILDLTVKFSRQEIAGVLGEVEHGDVVELTITGELNDGTTFEATDCITILSKHPEPRITADIDEVKLYPAIPNPFNPSTMISFYLPAACKVTLEIYDSSGRLISRLLDRVNKPKGMHKVDWKGIDRHGYPAASGVYFYRLTAGKETISKKMVLLK